MELLKLTATQLAEKIAAGETTALAATEAVLAQMEKAEAQIHAYLTVDAAGALARAAAVDEEIRAGRCTGALAGVPVAIKDNLCTKGIRTSCASKMLAGFVPAYSAGAVERLEQAGAVIIGKTNMDEFAMGSTTETSAFGATKNPWNMAYAAGGSSGGSCAAVAAGEAFFALGSDTGGSIRQPASHCGVCGMKPTYGTVSRYGLVAYASSLDQVGPIARSVEDCAAVLSVLAGRDERDATSLARSDVDFTAALVDDVRGLRIGIPRDYFSEGLDAEIKAAIRKRADALAEKGALVSYFDLGLVDYAVPCYYTIAAAEASSNLARFDGVKYGHRAADYEGLHELYKRSRAEGFGAEVKRRIMLGSFVLSAGYYDAYYLKALRVKALIKEAFDRAFADFDVILAPASPDTAPLLGSMMGDPMQMYLSDVYTVAVNLAGLPAMTLPCGFDKKGLPIGMQIIGDRFMEKKVLRCAYSAQQSYEGPALAGYERKEQRDGKDV